MPEQEDQPPRPARDRGDRDERDDRADQGRLAEPLRSRWSTRVFDDTHRLTSEELDTLLSAARWAPSSGNSQPWRFVVTRRDEAAHAVVLDALSRGNRGWVPRASAVLVAATQVAADPADPDGYVSPYAEHDLGQASAHLVLQARAMGLHAHVFGGFDHDGLAAALGVPAHVKVMTCIAVGRLGDPADVDEGLRERERRPRRRRPLDAFVHAGAWGTPWPA